MPTNPQVNPQYYNPTGAMGGTFAPAYIPGYEPAERALTNWQSTRGLTGLQNQGVRSQEELRMPPTRPSALQLFLGAGRGGMGGYQQTFGPGAVDPEMLRALSQNQPYDVAARRNEIAGVMAARDEERTNALQQYLLQQQIGLLGGRGMQSSGFDPSVAASVGA